MAKATTKTTLNVDIDVFIFGQKKLVAGPGPQRKKITRVQSKLCVDSDVSGRLLTSFAGPMR